MSLVPGDAVTALLNRESAPKTASTGPKSWLTLQPNSGGLVGLNAAFDTVTRQIMSKNLTPEGGENVGMSVAPKLVQDLNKDHADSMAGDWFRCVPIHAGNKGLSLYRPTAVTATGYTVAALGDLTAGLLIHAKGFTNAANNGLKVVAALSAALEIKAPGLVAETNPTNATIDVVGVQGAAGDIRWSAAGHLLTTIINCTLLGLSVGQWIKIGGTAALTSFDAPATQNGYARITAIAAGQISLTDHSFTVVGADTAAAKTIQLRFERFYRNYPLGHANFSKLTTQIEMEQPGAGTAGVSSFRNAKGLRVGMFELDAPLKNKFVATSTFVGMDLPDPVLQASRPADTATALEPLAAGLVHTSSDVKYVKLSNVSNNADLGSEVMSWKLTLSLGIKPQEIQGVFGANGHIDGLMTPTLTVGAYLTTDEIIKAGLDNRDVQFVEVFGNEDETWAVHLPAMKLGSPEENIAIGDAVTLDLGLPGHRNTTTGIVASLSTFGPV